jgi:hypothetical protein
MLRPDIVRLINAPACRVVGNIFDIVIAYDSERHEGVVERATLLIVPFTVQVLEATVKLAEGKVTAIWDVRETGS